MKTFINNRKNPKSEGLVVDLNERLFFYLGKISVFNVIRKCKRINNMYNFVDLWVIFNLFASIATSFMVVKYFINRILLLIILLYAVLRIFEIVIYQINVNLFDRYRNKLKNKDYRIKSPTRTVILLLHNYIEIIFWYVVIIVSLVRLSGSQVAEGYLFYIQSSFLCLTTFNHDLVANMLDRHYSLLSSVAMFEVVTGLVMTIISLANFIGKLPSEYKKEIRYTSKWRGY